MIALAAWLLHSRADFRQSARSAIERLSRQLAVFKKGPARMIPCGACRGAAFINCPDCGGTGSIEKPQIANCEQCKGSGWYKMRFGGKASRCPFCKGTGRISSLEKIVCEKCKGTGKIECASCRGSGRVPVKSK
jgi:DnaJ-class molecular chaperone